MKKPSPYFDVIVVGAGAAGIGIALMLQKIPGLSFTVLESGSIGESFRRWPKQTRFITPSFHSNPYGLVDLNAIEEQSSPALFCQSEHPCGEHYAEYLKAVVSNEYLPVVQHCRVDNVLKENRDNFVLETQQGVFRSQYLIWATGEFQFPDLAPFPGAEQAIHYANISDWSDFNDEAYTVIGGYESAIDASINLLASGHHVHILMKESDWNKQNSDPSKTLSPYSLDRFNEVIQSERLTITFDANIQSIKKTADTYIMSSEDGREWSSNTAPILATGFLSGGGAKQIAHLWEWDEDERILLTEADESTCTPGLFLVGPQVRHDEQLYCFIYKFRQRFTQLTELLALCLSLDSSALNASNPWAGQCDEEQCGDCAC